MSISPLADQILAALHEADGYLSLISYRYPDGLPEDLPKELKDASGRCRSLAKQLEQELGR